MEKKQVVFSLLLVLPICIAALPNMSSIGQESTTIASYTTTTMTNSYTTITQTLACSGNTQVVTLTAQGNTWVLGPGYQCGPTNSCMDYVCAGPISITVITGSQTPPSETNLPPVWEGALLMVVALIALVGTYVILRTRQKRRDPWQVCSTCGWRNAPENEYCAKCGSALRDQTRVF